MKDNDIKDLINGWEQIYNATAPSSDLLINQSEDNSIIKEMSFISSRKEFWESIVLLSAYDQEPSNTFDSSEMIGTIGQDIRDRSYSTKTNEFLNYCENYSTISRDAITSAIEVIFNVTTPEQVKDLIMHTAGITECEKYREDPIKLLECLKNSYLEVNSV
jgi:hypothetical protein